jgi:hypothetical protein
MYKEPALGSLAVTIRSPDPIWSRAFSEEKMMVKAIWNNAVIADSNDTVMVEGNHYFSMESVHQEMLRPSQPLPLEGRCQLLFDRGRGKVQYRRGLVLPGAIPGRKRDQGTYSLLEGRKNWLSTGLQHNGPWPWAIEGTHTFLAQARKSVTARI